MHVVPHKKVVQTGVFRAEAGKVTHVPDAIGREWVASKLAREATTDEAKSGKVAEEPKGK